MKKFNKTLLATALMVAAGSANASIATGASAEAFFVAYDSTNGKTFDLDLGSAASITALKGSVATKLSLNYNLGADTNWTSFQTGIDAAHTKFGVVVGNGVNALYTSATPSVWDKTTGLVSSGLTTTSGQVTNSVTNMAIAAGRINVGMGSTTSQNLSKLVLDAGTPGTGQWAQSAGSVNTLTNIWGAYGGANAAVDYKAAGAVADFFLTTAGATPTVKILGQWTLTNNSLAYQGGVPQVAAVPLPAAVWMFGAGLMGVLRLNHRKSMVV